MLVSMKAVLDLADAKKIAVGAFNITSLEGIQAVLGAAEELGQPVILQFAPVHESIIPLKVIGPVMVMMAEKSSVPVCVHLDHGDKLEILREALEMGFTSVMYDGSVLPFEENAANCPEAGLRALRNHPCAYHLSPRRGRTINRNSLSAGNSFWWFAGRYWCGAL